MSTGHRISSISLILLIVLSAIHAGDTAFQVSSTEYLRQPPSVVFVKGLCGTLKINQSSDDVFYQTKTRFDAGDVSESRRLTGLTRIVSDQRRDTLFITVLLPIDHMRKVRHPCASIFDKGFSAEYQSQTVEFSSRSGLDYTTDIVLGVTDSIKVIVDMRAVETILGNPGNSIELRTKQASIKGTLKGTMKATAERLSVELSSSSGNLDLHVDNLALEHHGEISGGSMTIDTKSGDIILKHKGKPSHIDIRQKDGRLTFIGTPPDSMTVNSSHTEIDGELRGSGHIQINQKTGNTRLRLSIRDFNLIDAKTISGSTDFKTSEDFSLVTTKTSLLYSHMSPSPSGQADSVEDIETSVTGHLIIRSDSGSLKLDLFNN